MAKIIEFEIKSVIKRPVDEVRSQFADYVYHAKNEVHKGINFTVSKQDNGESHYHQEVSVLGMPQNDKLISKTNPDGSVHTEVIEGVNIGLKIAFMFTSDDPSSTNIKANFSMPVSGFKSFIAPLFKMAVIKIAKNALKEDTTDLESGRYYQYLKKI